MSQYVETAFVQQYNATMKHLVQQKGSRLRDTVNIESLVGRKGFFDQIGAVTAQARTTRHGNSPIISTPHARRMVSGADFEWGDLVDQQDKLRMLTDPTTNYAQAAAYAMSRKLDDIVIAACSGTSYTGETGTTPVTLPTTQKVAASTTGLTLAKLLTTKEILDGNEVDEDEQRTFVCSSKQVSNLLNTTQVTSADYNTVKALAAGQVDTFLGFKFIRSERLTYLTTTSRACLAYVKSGITLAIQQDIMTRVVERDDKSFAMYAYACLTAGATRMEEEKVVEVACIES